MKWVEVRVEWVVERVNEEDEREWGVVCLDYGSNSVLQYVKPLMREIIIAASLPRPLRITLRGFVLTLFALRAILIAPSAAAKLS